MHCGISKRNRNLNLRKIGVHVKRRPKFSFYFMSPRNKNLDTLVSHGFGFYLDSKLLAESYFVSLRETMASGAKSRNRFDFLGFDLYSTRDPYGVPPGTLKGLHFRLFSFIFVFFLGLF